MLELVLANAFSGQGRNIADAAAKVAAGLDENGFIASTLSHAGKCSKGKYKELYHFDPKADIFPDYVVSIHLPFLPLFKKQFA